MPADFGVNLVASLSGDSGLGVTARNFALALQRHRVPFSVVDVRHPWGDALPVRGLEAPAVRPEDARFPINLFALQIPMYPELRKSLPALFVPGRFHAASMWWEASALPPAWVEDLSRFDAVLAGSEFLVQVLAAGLALTPIIHVPHPLALPDGVRASRERFTLPDDATVFGLSFDPHSDSMRKNPVGAIQAFRMAFEPGIADAMLAVRVHHGAREVVPPVLAAMRRAAGDDPRIRFLIDPLGYDDVLAFYASCDAYVSLHRGEGLGLGMLESMALGRPVIATGWSGNMSFMDYSSACPVRYRMVRAIGAKAFTQPGFLGKQARWAEPVLEDAAAWMRRLHDDRQLRESLGRRAREAFAAHQSRAWDRRWIDELESLWRAQAFLPRAAGKHSTAD